MKILSSVLNCIFLFAVFFSFLLNFQISALAWDNSATNTQFEQSILPVRFIYLNNNDDVVKIFNNVTETNTAYILKFYREDTNSEVPISDSLLNNFKQLINKVDISQQGFIDIGQNNQNARQVIGPAVEFFNSPQGLQEIHTFI